MDNPYQPPVSSSPLPARNTVRDVPRWLIGVNVLYTAVILFAFWAASRDGLGSRDFWFLAFLLSPVTAVAAVKASGALRPTLFLLACSGATVALVLVLFALATDKQVDPIVIVILLPVALVLLNLFGARPNNSSKPTPLRGAA